jgi:hypothetical protein
MASTMDQITALLGELSFEEKLTINEQLATSIRKEGGGKGKVTKSKKVKEDDEKPKRKAALGTLAWGAYVKHMKTTRPDAFEGLKKESEKLVIVKGIRAEDPDGYTSFVEAWKTEHSETSSVASVPEAEEAVTEAEEAEAEVPAPVKIKKVAPKPEKLAPKVEKEAKKEVKKTSK